MRRFLKTLVVLIIILAMAGATGAWLWHRRGDGKMSLRTAPVKRGDLTATISATGTIEPLEVVDVGAQVAGRDQRVRHGQGRQDRGLRLGGRARRAAGEDRRLGLCRRPRGRQGAGGTGQAGAERRGQPRTDEGQARPGRGGMEPGAGAASEALISQVDYDTAKANYEIAKANVSVQPNRQAKAAPAGAGRPGQGAAQSGLLHHQLAGQRRHHRPPRQHRPDGRGEPQRAEPVPHRARPDEDADLGVGQRGRRGPDQAGCARHLHRGRLSRPGIPGHASARSASTRP